VSNKPLRCAKYLVNDRLICGDDDGNLFVYDFNLSRVVCEQKAHTDFLRDIQVLFKEKKIFVLTCGDDGNVNAFEIQGDKLEKIHENEAHQDYAMKLALNPKDINMFASCSMDNSIKIFNFDTFTN